jgi:hypothetical protein
MQRLELARKGQQFRHFDDFDRLWWIGKLDRRLRLVVIGNLRRRS